MWSSSKANFPPGNHSATKANTMWLTMTNISSIAAPASNPWLNLNHLHLFGFRSYFMIVSSKKSMAPCLKGHFDLSKIHSESFAGGRRVCRRLGPPLIQPSGQYLVALRAPLQLQAIHALHLAFARFITAVPYVFLPRLRASRVPSWSPRTHTTVSHTTWRMLLASVLARTRINANRDSESTLSRVGIDAESVLNHGVGIKERKKERF